MIIIYCEGKLKDNFFGHQHVYYSIRLMPKTKTFILLSMCIMHIHVCTILVHLLILFVTHQFTFSESGQLSDRTGWLSIIKLQHLVRPRKGFHDTRPKKVRTVAMTKNISKGVRHQSDLFTHHWLASLRSGHEPQRGFEVRVSTDPYSHVHQQL